MEKRRRRTSKRGHTIWEKKERKKMRRGKREGRNSSKTTRPHENRSAKAYEIMESSTSSVNIRRFVAWMVLLTKYSGGLTTGLEHHVYDTQRIKLKTKKIQRQSWDGKLVCCQSSTKVRKPCALQNSHTHFKYFEYVRLHLNFQSRETDILDNVLSVNQAKKAHIISPLYHIFRPLCILPLLFFSSSISFTRRFGFYYDFSFRRSPVVPVNHVHSARSC